MNIKIEQSEFVTLEGLTEAAISSSDVQLLEIVNYADAAASYLPDQAWDDESPMHPILQVREACLCELMRRHGVDFDLEKTLQTHLMSFSVGQRVSACL